MSGARLHSAVFGNPEQAGDSNILVTVFLRGGVDVLNLIPPIGGVDRGLYETARPNLHIPTASALQLGTSEFGLHPGAAALHTLYGDGKLAIVQATGLNEDTRSHFQAMTYIESGMPGTAFGGSGWISRHLSSSPVLPDSVVLPAMAAGTYVPNSLAGTGEVAAFTDTAGMTLNGFQGWRSTQRAALRSLFASGSSLVHVSGLQAMNVSNIVELEASDAYTPLPGVTYPDSGFGDQLKTIAQMIKLDLGLHMATVDLGGWDTHDGQGAATGYFHDLLMELSDGLAAFYADLDTSGSDPYSDRVTIVVMSEFGRRLRENNDWGTDHGHGSAMLVLGAGVNGGLYGTWPGLDTGQLYDFADLAVTTDYRRVLSEILIRRMENPNLGIVFPGYENYSPLGVVQGVDLPPIYDGRVPTAVGLKSAQTQSSGAGKALTAAGVGLAATAGLVALRNRGAES